MLSLFVKGMNYLFGKTLQRKNFFVSSSLNYLQRGRSIDLNYFDYIRLSTLELVSYEINKRNLKGNVAELGTYQGKFAKYINLFFRDRNLYLFDTFEGFDVRDINEEQKRGFSSGAQDFTKTSVDAVLKIMPFPEKCIPVKGFFPQSAKEIREEFVFVSIDADLYEPIYEGLKYFYQNLVKGGYIFVHDLNNDNYKGAREAVKNFCEEKNIWFTPIPDSAGTAVIIK